MLVETNAVVISTIKYGDSSLIARCYCQQIGLKSFLLKGILSSKKGSIKKSLFQPLSLLTLNINIKNDTSESLLFIKEAKIYHPLQNIHLNIKKNTVALFLTEVLMKVMEEEGDPNPPLFSFLEHAILQLEEKSFSALFHLKFLIDLTRYIGFYPNILNFDHPCFDMENGCFCLQTDSKKIIIGKELEAFKTLLGTNFDKLIFPPITSVTKIKLLDLIVDYYHLHMQKFSKIKSLTILHEVFRET